MRIGDLLRRRGLVVCAWACSAAAASLTLGACGEDLPSSVEAEVSGYRITQTALEHAMVGRRAVSRSAQSAPDYWPSDVRGCVSAKRKRERQADDATVEAACERERGREETAALRFLIQGRWYVLEARRRGLPVPTTRKSAIPASAHSGVPPADLRDALKVYQLRLSLTQAILARIPTPSEAEVARRYRARRGRYRTQDLRFIRALVARDRSEARAIAARLRQGATWDDVVNRFRGRGVTVPFEGYRRLEYVSDRRVRQRVQALDRGDVGMVDVADGWYVFRVAAVHLPRQMRAEEAASVVTEEFRQRWTREAIEAFNAKLASRYRDDTLCADRHDVPECRD